MDEKYACSNFISKNYNNAKSYVNNVNQMIMNQKIAPLYIKQMHTYVGVINNWVNYFIEPKIFSVQIKNYKD